MKNFTRNIILSIALCFALASADAQNCIANLSANGATQFCAGGSVTLTSYYDQFDYDYQWYQDGNVINGAASTNYVATQNGSYWCQISSYSCFSIDPLSIYVSVIPLPIATISVSSATVICTGDSATLNANTGGGITYQWLKNGVTIAGAVAFTYYAKLSGSYKCIETNSCGSDTSNSITIALNQLPSAIISTNSITKFCLGNPVSSTLNVNTAIGTTYQWRKNSSNISGATLSSFTATATGIYTCRVTNCFGSSVSNSISVAVDSTCTSCLYFDGLDDRVTIPVNTIYNVGAACTVEAWIRDDAPQNAPSVETILSNYSTSTPGGIRVIIINGRLGGSLGPDLRDGQCHHIAVTHDAVNSNWFYYVDGVQIYRSPTGAYINSTIPLLIGAENNGGTFTNYFKGIIKEVRFWSDAYHLSDMKNVVDGASNPKLVGYWRLNDGTGQTVTDYSTTANNGTRGTTTVTESTDPAWGTGCPACPLPSATITANGSTTFCFGGSVTLNAQPTGAGYTYQWRVNGAIIIGATSSSYNAIASGNYDVLISNGCSSYSNVITVTANGNLSNYVLQPNGTNGMDANSGSANFGGDPDLKIDAWTQYSGNAQRGFIRFDLSALPVNTVVHHAILTLYNSPTATLSGGITNPAGAHYHGYAGLSNASWLQKITSPWSESVGSQPTVSIVNQLTLPQDTNAHQDYLVDVTYLVQDMIANPASNYGFRLRLKNETYYTALLFASSDYPDSTKWPKLSVFYYDIATTISASGSTALCTGNTVTLNANSGAGLSYQWQLNNANIPGATAMSYAASTAGNYTCKVTNSCGTLTSNAIVVTVNSPPTPPVSISVTGGSAKVCPGDTRTYSTPLVAGATFNWTVPTGAVINSGQGTRTINVTYNSGFTSNGTISVSKVQGCGLSTPKTLAVNRNIPSTPSAISGTTYGLCGATNKVYTVTQVAGMTYQWTVPAVATIVSGQGTNSITVNFPSTNFTGTVSVKAVNTCGAGTARNLTVRAIPSTAVSITGPITACANQQNVAYSTAAIATATSYTWGVPSGSMITSGQGTNSIVMNYGTASGTVKVRAGNGCGAGSYKNLAVLINCREGFEAAAEGSGQLAVVIYPNPSATMFTVKFNSSDDEIFSLTVRDIIGKVVETYINIDTQQSFDFGAQLNNGIYITEILTGSERKIFRIVKSE